MQNIKMIMALLYGRIFFMIKIILISEHAPQSHLWSSTAMDNMPVTKAPPVITTPSKPTPQADTPPVNRAITYKTISRTNAAPAPWVARATNSEILYSAQTDIASLTPSYVTLMDYPVMPHQDEIIAWRKIAHADKADIFFISADAFSPTSLFCDMDSTLIPHETLDEMAAACGLGDEVRAITTAAMTGALDFEAAFTKRLQLFAGTTRKFLNEITAKLTFHEGAESLIATCRALSMKSYLVTGGFSPMTDYVAAYLKMDGICANQLTFSSSSDNPEEDIMTGSWRAPLIDGNAKKSFLETTAPHQATAAIGDGANDLLMLKASSCGVGYHPKAVLTEQLPNIIIQGNLNVMAHLLLALHIYIPHKFPASC
jgi:phosphoserine phosphatase SerB